MWNENKVMADANAKDMFGKTPLHCAQSPEIAKGLLNASANPHARDKFGWTPLDRAQSPEIAKVLLDADRFSIFFDFKDAGGVTEQKKIRAV